MINTFLDNVSLFMTPAHLLMVGLLFAFLLLHILSFFVSGKATDSINDEVISAFTLLGMVILIFLGTTLIHGLLTMFISNNLLTFLLAGALHLVIAVYVISVIYDLPALKAILFWIISALMITAVTVGSFFALQTFVPGVISTIQQSMTQEAPASSKMSYEEYIRRGGTPIPEEGTPETSVSTEATKVTDVPPVTEVPSTTPATDNTPATPEPTTPAVSDTTSAGTETTAPDAATPKKPGLPSEPTPSQ